MGMWADTALKDLNAQISKLSGRCLGLQLGKLVFGIALVVDIVGHFFLGKPVPMMTVELVVCLLLFNQVDFMTDAYESRLKELRKDVESMEAEKEAVIRAGREQAKAQGLPFIY